MGSTSDEGESSSHTSSTDERPLKKARYIWQIKGKYHLKTTGEDEKDTLEVNACENSVANDKYLASDKVVDVPCANDEQKQNVLPTVSNVLDPSPTTLSDSDRESLHRSNEMYRLSNIISNLELSKWQDRQVARSFVDNTINGVLEVMGFTPLPFEAEDISDDDDMLLPEGSGNDEVEDEAVLMAIHSHGLQRSEGGHSRRRSCCNNNESLLPQCSCRPSIHNNEHNVQLPDPFHRRPVIFSPIEVDHSTAESSSRISLASKEATNTSSAISISVANVNYSSSTIEIDDKSSDCVQISVETTETIPEGVTLSKSVPLNNNAVTQMSTFDQNDFLDQAVAVAILKKGLGTFSAAELG